ncbi:MAG TPA: glutathione S-transferase N-terminal domain-containing protein [Candidatus Limnocylindrales bacterium]|nr:glutathione S-transferase N-terminal domain-containing protein [Candidatus Limnocylindrales bacterium]
MRLRDPETLLTLALYALPVAVALFGFGVPAAFFASLVIIVVGIFVRSRRLVGRVDPSRLELHTITYSHYVEKARWCLDRLGVAYEEVPSIGILGVLLTGRTVPTLAVPATRTSIGDSTEILRFLWGRYSGELPDRTRFLAPSPEAIALETHFNEDLGVPVRLWSYWHLLERPDLTLIMWGHEEPSIPQWQKALLPPLRPVLAALLRRMLGLNEANAARGIVKTREIFAEVDTMLADGRRYLMGGDELTFVDITFASLAALIIFPDGYTGGSASVTQLPVERLPADWRAEVEMLRATRAGQFVMRMYAEERRPR